MAVDIVVASRTETEVNLYWAPDSDPKTSGYRLYTSLDRNSGYTKQIDFIRNAPSPSGKVPQDIRSFIKPGSVSVTLPYLDYGYACDQEFFVKVTTVSSSGMECPLTSVSYTRVRLEGHTHQDVYNISFEDEKGVLGWEEDNNKYRRINAHVSETDIQGKYALDVHLVDSKTTVENEVDSLGDVIPLEVGGKIATDYPSLSRSTQSFTISTSELLFTDGSIDPGFPFNVHSISMQSSIPISCQIVLKLRVGSGEEFIIDSREMLSSDGDLSYFFSLDKGLMLMDTDLIVLETIGLVGQAPDINVTILKSTLNKG